MSTKRTKIVREVVVEDTAVLIKKPESDFWKKKTVDELEEEQGVKVFDFDALAGKFWPEGADFDEYMAAINSGRKYPRDWKSG